MGCKVRLYFFRHGPALSRSEWDSADDQRPLSEPGESVVRSVSRRMKALELGVGVILTSPYERALRTAAILRDVLGEETPLLEEHGLEPGTFNLDSLADMLEPHRTLDSVVLVGHEPSMSSVASEMVGGGTFVLKKAGLARIDLYSGTPLSGELRWLVPPSLLR